MATTLWHVTVTSIEGCELRADLERGHDDAGPFADDAAFALRLLHEQARAYDAASGWVAAGPLAEVVGEEDVTSDGWIRAHAADFVSGVEVSLPDGVRGDATGAVARYAITVTSPRWLEHLEPGQRWRSAAYS